MKYMMWSFSQLVHEHARMCPPFIAMVVLFMIGCAIMYFLTRGKGFLVAGSSGIVWMLPWLMSITR